jgi:hypothetical protein
MVRKILLTILVLGLIGAGVGIYLWNKPHAKVEDAKGLAITAAQLAKEFGADENAANAKYLNKAIEVSGTVSEVEKNQDGGTMVILDTGDPMAGVQCTMRDKGAVVNKGQNVVLKGFCSGAGITGVSLTDCIISK